MKNAESEVSHVEEANNHVVLQFRGTKEWRAVRPLDPNKGAVGGRVCESGQVAKVTAQLSWGQEAARTSTPSSSECRSL